MRCVLVLALLFASSLFAPAQVVGWDNGLARTPPMGWNSWNHFGCSIDCDRQPFNCISQALLIQMADAMVLAGMKDVGYEYINVDDCWLAKSRAPDGTLQPDPKRFPLGIKYVADYIHKRGLKFGIYQDCGKQTCEGFPGSFGYEALDVKTFAEWGVDLLKLDGCYFPVDQMEAKYTQWSQLLGNASRPMVFSCSWPTYADLKNMSVPWAKVASVCNLWREWIDIRDEWATILKIVDYQEEMKLAQWARPGAWNDPDMLEVGNGGMTYDEYKSHFSLWAMMAAPLIAGNDIRTMSHETRTILTAREVIAVNQDPLGRQGGRLRAQSGLEVWTRRLHDNSQAVLLWNRNTSRTNITVTWAEMGLASRTQRVRNLWTESDEGTFVNAFTAPVEPHGVVMVKVSPT